MRGRGRRQGQHRCHDDGRDKTNSAGSTASDSDDSFHDVSQTIHTTWLAEHNEADDA